MNKQINTSLSTFLIFGIFLLLNSYFNTTKEKRMMVMFKSNMQMETTLKFGLKQLVYL